MLNAYGPAIPLPLDLNRDALTAHVLDSLRKRVMGRRVSFKEVRRVATEVGLIVRDAVRQPQVQGALGELAREEGVSRVEAQKRWAAWQEADLLLESGGDPDALSPAYAEGIAQWLAGTGKGVGLAIDLKASRRLSATILGLKWRIAWIKYLQHPDPNAKIVLPPVMMLLLAGAPLPKLETELEMLRRKRRKVDARYDPRPAIFAQTRYLLRLYRRFPSPDWLFQAYHGGEGGVQRLLKLYCGGRWPGSPAAAIRAGNQGSPLRFEDLYFTTTPHAHPQAFSYLYGRSDDHRHYWWKLRVAQEALARYREDPAAFEKLWETYRPGHTSDAYWYPQALSLEMADLPALQRAVTIRNLVPVADSALWSVRPPPDAPIGEQRWYAALRPEASGALVLLAETYRRAGGQERLMLGDLALTRSYIVASKLLHPPPPAKERIWPPDPDAKILIGDGPPPEFDFHTTGLVFDFLRPAGDPARKVLEFALDYWQSRQVIAWTDAKDRGQRRYHVLSNPRYAATLAKLTAPGNVPRIPGL